MDIWTRLAMTLSFFALIMAITAMLSQSRYVKHVCDSLLTIIIPSWIVSILIVIWTY